MLYIPPYYSIIINGRMKSEEAMDFLTRIRKTLPGIENFLQATLVKEHLSKVARDELQSLLHILSHIQLAALPSQGKKPAQRPPSKAPLSSYSSTSNAESEHTHSLSASHASSVVSHTETDTEQSVTSFDSSPFSSPTRTIGLVSGACATSETKSYKTENAGSSRGIECKNSERQPIAVSRSGRAIKVASGRVNSDYVSGGMTRGKRRKESSDSSLSSSATKKRKPNQTHDPSKELHNCKHYSNKTSITHWTESTKRRKQDPDIKSTPHDPLPIN